MAYMGIVLSFERLATLPNQIAYTELVTKPSLTTAYPITTKLGVLVKATVTPLATYRLRAI